MTMMMGSGFVAPPHLTENMKAPAEARNASLSGHQRVVRRPAKNAMMAAKSFAPKSPARSSKSSYTATTASSSSKTPPAEVMLGLTGGRIVPDELSVTSSVTSFSRSMPMVEAMMDAMHDDRLADVTLIGRKGVRVLAAKYVIGCQNHLLQERLYRDPNRSEVYIGEYDEQVLLALKEFCHTGSISENQIATEVNDSTARLLVGLTDLALSYQFDSLFEATEIIVSNVLHRSPELIFAIYDKASEDERTRMLCEYSVDFIKERSPTIVTSTFGLRYLSHLEMFVYDMRLNEASTFFVVSKWIDWHGRTPENVLRAQRLCAELDLSLLIDSIDMYRRVRRSGFVDLGILEQFFYGKRDSQTKTPTLVEEDEEDLEEETDSDSSVAEADQKSATSESTVQGVCYQLTPQGDVLVCSTESPVNLPDFHAYGQRLKYSVRPQTM